MTIFTKFLFIHQTRLFFFFIIHKTQIEKKNDAIANTKCTIFKRQKSLKIFKKKEKTIPEKK